MKPFGRIRKINKIANKIETAVTSGKQLSETELQDDLKALRAATTYSDRVSAAGGLGGGFVGGVGAFSFLTTVVQTTFFPALLPSLMITAVGAISAYIGSRYGHAVDTALHAEGLLAEISQRPDD